MKEKQIRNFSIQNFNQILFFCVSTACACLFRLPQAPTHRLIILMLEKKMQDIWRWLCNVHESITVTHNPLRVFSLRGNCVACAVCVAWLRPKCKYVRIVCPMRTCMVRDESGRESEKCIYLVQIFSYLLCRKIYLDINVLKTCRIFQNEIHYIFAWEYCRNDGHWCVNGKHMCISVTVFSKFRGNVRSPENWWRWRTFATQNA